MSDKPPIKRGILSSLMGLFGEEDEDKDGESGFDPPVRPTRDGDGEGAEAGDIGFAEADEPGSAEGVVREAYEPGWYAISSSRTFPRTGHPPVGDEAAAETEVQPSFHAPGGGPWMQTPAPEVEQREAEQTWPPVGLMPPGEAVAPADEWVQEEPQEERFAAEADQEAHPEGEEGTWQAEADQPHDEAAQAVDAPPAEEAPLVESEAVPGPEDHVAIEPSAEPQVEHHEPEVAGTHEAAEEPPGEPVEAPSAEAAFETAGEGPVQGAEEGAVETPAEEFVEPAAAKPLDHEETVEAPMAAEHELMDEHEGHDYGAVAFAATEEPELTSRVAAERRAALEAVISRGIREDDIDTVSPLLQDPERDIRLLALEALADFADRVPVGSLRQALRDPSDEVRARAVRVAARRAGQEVPEVYRLVAERQWPATQQAALAELPGAIESYGVHESDLVSMLSAISEMESRATGPERFGFQRLARAVGVDRLIGELESSSSRRGAARLLMEEGSIEALRALTDHAGDPDHEVDSLARAARDLLGPEAAEAQPEEAPHVEVLAPYAEAESTPEDELIAGLARALADPDEAVRIRARGALGAVDRNRLVDWARRQLRSGDSDRGMLGALVVEGAGIVDIAGDVLERAAAVPAEARGPFVRALSSLQLDPDQLVSLARGIDSTSRPEAIRVLWPVAGRALLPSVHDLLEDSSAAVRVAALEVFGESGDPSTIEVAQSVLERDSSPVVRATAIQVIGRAGTEQRVASLEKALSDPDPDVRATAVEVLPTGMSRQAAQLLLDALADEDERVWQAAVRHLASVPDRDRSIVWTAIERCPASRREALLGTLERTSAERLALLALDHLSSPDVTERTLAISLAGRAATPECVRGIVQALQDPAPQVRRTAASALSSLRSSDSISGLARALSDPDVEVRVEAVRALSLIDDDNVLDPLISALKDPEVRVRDVAGEALVRWRSPGVARRLAIALQSPSLRRPASDALARMGTSAVDPLVDILMGDEPELAETVGQLLESLVGPEVFIDRLGAMEAAHRLRAVEALGAIGGDRGVEGLIRALSDPVESIRIRAVSLLGELGDQRAFDAVKRAFLGDPVPEVVQAAEVSLRRLQAAAEPGA